MSLWCDFLAPIFFAKSNLMDVIVFHDIICSFDFLCSLVERAQKLFGIKASFFFEEMDQSLPTIEDGTAGFLEILDSVWSAKAPNWMSLRMICKNAFNERCYLNCLMWTISLLFRKNGQKLPDSVVYLLVPGQLVTTRIVSYQFSTFLC